MCNSYKMPPSIPLLTSLIHARKQIHLRALKQIAREHNGQEKDDGCPYSRPKRRSHRKRHRVESYPELQIKGGFPMNPRLFTFATVAVLLNVLPATAQEMIWPVLSACQNPNGSALPSRW